MHHHGTLSPYHVWLYPHINLNATFFIQPSPKKPSAHRMIRSCCRALFDELIERVFNIIDGKAQLRNEIEMNLVEVNNASLKVKLWLFFSEKKQHNRIEN